MSGEKGTEIWSEGCCVLPGHPAFSPVNCKARVEACCGASSAWLCTGCDSDCESGTGCVEKGHRLRWPLLHVSLDHAHLVSLPRVPGITNRSQYSLAEFRLRNLNTALQASHVRGVNAFALPALDQTYRGNQGNPTRPFLINSSTVEHFLEPCKIPGRRQLRGSKESGRSRNSSVVARDKRKRPMVTLSLNARRHGAAM